MKEKWAYSRWENTCRCGKRYPVGAWVYTRPDAMDGWVCRECAHQMGALPPAHHTRGYPVHQKSYKPSEYRIKPQRRN